MSWFTEFVPAITETLYGLKELLSVGTSGFGLAIFALVFLILLF